MTIKIKCDKPRLVGIVWSLHDQKICIGFGLFRVEFGRAAA